MITESVLRPVVATPGVLEEQLDSTGVSCSVQVAADHRYDDLWKIGSQVLGLDDENPMHLDRDQIRVREVYEGHVPAPKIHRR